ncbi:MAG: hypothetical protein IJ481_03310 [Alphaproteobacteria bacterium]|nr:hypothetical protein [Alphaproteobacteria bacterium]
MKHTKLVMLGVLTSSLYASGFYGGFDIGVSNVRSKSVGYNSSSSMYKLFNMDKTKAKFISDVFIAYKANYIFSAELNFNPVGNNVTYKLSDLIESGPS